MAVRLVKSGKNVRFHSDTSMGNGQSIEGIAQGKQNLPSLDEIAFLFDKQAIDCSDLNKPSIYYCETCKMRGQEFEVSLRRKDHVQCPRCFARKVFKLPKKGATYYSAR